MAAKKKTKAKTSKAKTITAKAAKSAKPAKKAKKPVLKATKKKASSSKPTKKAAAPKKKGTAKTKKAPKVKKTVAPKVKKTAAPAKVAKSSERAKEKAKKAPKVPKAAKKPAEIEISKVLAAPVAEPVVIEPEEVVLTDSEGRRYCRVKDCDQLATVDAYCRYHYLLFWKKIQVRKKILDEGKLEKYIEELTARYPDKYLDMLRKDLRSEKEFLAAIQELEIDDTNDDMDEEDSQSYIDEVRGVSETSGRTDDDY